MNRSNFIETGRERGQTLILFGLLATTMLLLVMVVVDVGFYLQERQKTQNAADAAALAGAQDLPDDPVAAEVAALQYLEDNGISSDGVEISFECTSQVEQICNEAAGKYDTIVVTPISKAPSFFGGVLSLVTGGSSCWVDGCDVQAEAAGCRGACGPIGNAPVDVMTIIDRSGSMSSDDLDGAKTAAKSILENFNPDLQRSGLAVLGQSSTTSTCTGSYSGGLGRSTSSGGTWLPIPMTDDYQNADGSLATGSQLVKTINCLNTSSVGTNIGEPLKAASDHLIADGRPDVTWGIILLSDGAANAAPTIEVPGPAQNTGWHTCDAHSAQSPSSGDNNGFQTNASRACSNGNGYAADDDSGTGTSTSCTSTAKDRHRFFDFNLDNDISGSSTISGIEVRLDAWAAGSGTKRMCVELSSNGSSWTTPVYVSLGSSEQTFYLGNSTDLWGRAWDGDDFDSSDFRVRITNVGSSTSTDFRLDYLAVKVHYAGTQTVWDGHLGPCDYAMQQADAAKAAGIEVYSIAWGANDYCIEDDSASDWDGASAASLLEALATDENHFFDEPKTTDLEPIFDAIGSELTGGSRLVR